MSIYRTAWTAVGVSVPVDELPARIADVLDADDLDDEFDLPEGIAVDVDDFHFYVWSTEGTEEAEDNQVAFVPSFGDRLEADRVAAFARQIGIDTGRFPAARFVTLQCR